MKISHPIIALTALLMISGCQSSRKEGGSARESAGNMANATSAVAVIRAVKGEAIVTGESGSGTPAQVGMKLIAGSRVETKEGGTVDLFLAENGPVVRATEDTALTFKALEFTGESPKKVIQTRILLHKGRILGNVKELGEASVYEVSSRLARFTTHGSQYDFNASGALTVVNGKAFYTPQGGSVTLVRAGETVNPPEPSPKRKF